MGKKLYAALILIADQKIIKGFDKSMIDLRMNGVKSSHTPDKLYIKMNLTQYLNKKEIIEAVKQVAKAKDNAPQPPNDTPSNQTPQG
jgi:hypothetical protein